MLISLLFILSHAVEARDAVFDQILKQPSGRDTKISQLAPESEQPWLVLFWASWCGPCKAEMKLVTDNQSLVSSLNVVAVNVDENEDWPAAKGILQRVDWPFSSLRDIGGRYFYQARPSGELPYGLLLSPKGTTISTLQHIDVESLKHLANLAQTAIYVDGPVWSQSLEIKAKQTNQKDSQGKEPRVAALSSSLNYRSTQWNAMATYKLLGQDLQNSQSSKHGWEDELADSHIEYVSDRYRWRLGDDFVSALNLLSIRRIQGTNQDFSLLGGHFNYLDERFSVLAAAGKVRNSLYGNDVDPLQDVSVALANQFAGVLQAGYQISESPFFDESHVEFAIASYTVDKNTDLGQFNEHRDVRYGIKVAESSSIFGYELQYSEIDIDKDDKKSFIGQLDFWLGETFKVPVSLLRYENLPTHGILPATLINEPGTALLVSDGGKFEGGRIGLDGSFSKFGVSLSTTYESTQKTQNAQQTSHAIDITHPYRDLKIGLMVQTLTDNLTAQEKFFVLGGYLSQDISGQLTSKVHSKSERIDGESHQLALSYDMSSLWGLKTHSKPTLWLTSTKQTAGSHYLAISQIQKNDLFSIALSYDWKKLHTKLSVGQEPGGYVCANGICALRPPLDGAKFDLSYVHTY